MFPLTEGGRRRGCGKILVVLPLSLFHASSFSFHFRSQNGISVLSSLLFPCSTAFHPLSSLAAHCCLSSRTTLSPCCFPRHSFQNSQRAPTLQHPAALKTFNLELPQKPAASPASSRTSPQVPAAHTQLPLKTFLELLPKI